MSIFLTLDTHFNNGNTIRYATDRSFQAGQESECTQMKMEEF